MEKIYKKIKRLDELSKELKQFKKQGKTVVHCHGVFDLIHPGHIRHLAAAKREGDILVVTITADKYVRKGPGRPIFNENLRAETLASMESVDYVAINHEPTAVNCIRALIPNVYVKGQDYIQKNKDVTGKINEEEAAIISVGGKIVFTEDITFSSSKLINDHFQVYPESTRRYLKDFSLKYSLDYIFNVLDKIEKLKILVIGEAIIDQYNYCQGMDKSRKSSVVAHKYLSHETFAGGSLAVANHVAELTSNASLITVTGSESEFDEFILKAMNSSIHVKRFTREDAPTLVKNRFISLNQKLFEICYLDDAPLPFALSKKIASEVKKTIARYDLVIVSDFGHGFLGEDLIQAICKGSKFLAVNTQTNGANMGFNLITNYSGVDYAALDELEMRYAAHDKNGDLSNIVKKVAKKIKCKNLIVTRGNNGALSYMEEKEFISAPALATNVVDAVGAGDAFFAYTAPLVAMGVPRDLVIFIGNAVGALAVQIVCNREPVSLVDLKKFITAILK